MLGSLPETNARRAARRDCVTTMHEKGKKRAKRFFGACSDLKPNFQVVDFKGKFGRGGRIRTFDLLVPNQALYQAEPRPDVSSLVCCTPLAQARTIEFVSDTQKLRELPAVHEVLEQLAPSLARFPRALVVSEVRRAIDAARAEILAGYAGEPAMAARVERALADLERPSLRPVINATGVVLHTNLGRAPLGPVVVPPGYSNLEYDLETGRRGQRDVTSRRCWIACW